MQSLTPAWNLTSPPATSLLPLVRKVICFKAYMRLDEPGWNRVAFLFQGPLSELHPQSPFCHIKCSSYSFWGLGCRLRWGSILPIIIGRDVGFPTDQICVLFFVFYCFDYMVHKFTGPACSDIQATVSSWYSNVNSFSFLFLFCFFSPFSFCKGHFLFLATKADTWF